MIDIIDIIKGSFDIHTYPHYIRPNKELISINSCEHRAILTNIYHNKIFIPTIVSPFIGRDLVINSAACWPIYIRNIIEVKSSSQILKEGLYNGTEGDLQLYKTPKDQYILGKGLILKRNWLPIIICGWEYECTEEFKFNDNTRGTPIMYVNPSIFIDKDNLSKYIIKNMIKPAAEMRVLHSFSNINANNFVPIKIIIGNYNNIILTAPAPTVPNFSEIAQLELAERLENDEIILT